MSRTATPPRTESRDEPTLASLISAPPTETIAVLRAAATASAALARLDATLARSTVREPAIAAFALLDAAACVALDHVPLDVGVLLCAPVGARDPAVQRLLGTRELARDGGTDAMNTDLLLALGARENADRPGVRARALGTRELATLQEDEKPPRGAARLMEGLQAWASLIERGGRDVHPLVLVAAAHRRWLALRPFATGNVRLAQLLDTLLLRGEGMTSTLDLPLARWFSRRIDTYRLRLRAGARDEAGWIAWWLEGVAHACEETHEQLLAWERASEELARHPALGRAEPDEQVLSLLVRPQVEHQAAVAASGLSRVAATRWLESLVEDGVLRTLGGARERRYANVRVLGLLLEPASA